MNSTELSDQEAAKVLAESLGKLPLALEQAKGYMERTRSSPSRYQTLFEKRQKLVKGGRALTGRQAILTSTWEISLQQIKKTSPAGADLMRLCAFLAPENIPLDDIRRGSKSLPRSLAAAIEDQEVFDEAVETLKQYSVAKVLGNSFLSIHRAVQAVVRSGMGEHDRKKWARAAVSVMAGAFPAECDDWRTWPVASILLPHAKKAAGHAKELHVAPEETSQLLNHLGVYSVGRADFQEARDAFEQALTIDKAAYGDDDPRVARDLTNIGFLLKNQGELEKALKRFERALEINQLAYGSDHPAVATSLNHLGIVLKDQGQKGNRSKLKQAQKLFERALEIDKAAYGESDPEVARDITNLGFLLKDQGQLDKDGSKMEEAKQHFEQALEINKAAYSAYLRRLSSSANNFGMILKDQGNLDRARRFFKRALAVDELAYGTNHPEVAMDISNLGFLMKDQGQLEGARGYFERALQINEAAYGHDHPNVAGIVNSLGIVLKDQGDIVGANAHFERALKIFQRFLGEKHPSTVAVRNNLTSL
jgi:tetratricopeptide (TPR) repeat protein